MVKIAYIRELNLSKKWASLIKIQQNIITNIKFYECTWSLNGHDHVCQWKLNGKDHLHSWKLNLSKKWASLIKIQQNIITNIKFYECTWSLNVILSLSIGRGLYAEVLEEIDIN
jgi:hypothetical protein